MDKSELLSCMHHAAEALAEFRHLVPEHCPAAHVQVEEALQHFEYAVILMARSVEGTAPPAMRLVE